MKNWPKIQYNQVQFGINASLEINEKACDCSLFTGRHYVGGWNPPYAQEIGCHFSWNDPNVLKLPDFFKNDVGPKVKESFWAYLE